MAGDLIRTLREWLNDSDCDKRADVVHGICFGLVRGTSLDGLLTKDDIDDLLIFALNQIDDCRLARVKAIQCLRDRQSIRALNSLIGVIRDTDPDLVVRAISAVGHIAAIQPTDAVLDNLGRAREEIRLVKENFQNKNDRDTIREAIRNIDRALGR